MRKGGARLPKDWKESEETSLKEVFESYKERGDVDVITLVHALGEYDLNDPPTQTDIANHLLFLKLVTPQRHLSLISKAVDARKGRRGKRRHGRVLDEDQEEEENQENEEPNKTKKRKLQKESSLVVEQQDEVVIFEETD